VDILTTGIKLTYLATINEDTVIEVTSYIQCHRHSDSLRAALSGYRILVKATWTPGPRSVIP
jgi:hypothetical protein